MTLLFFTAPCDAQTDGEPPALGIYYFSGWKSHQKGAPSDEPWKVIKAYPELEPLLGWYAEDDPYILEQQLMWMRYGGIDYVVFDWLWGPDGRPYLDHALKKFLSLTESHGLDFSVLWTNHTKYTFTLQQFRTLFKFVAKHYLSHPRAKKFDGKPAFFIFSAQIFARNANALGLSSSDLLQIARDEAREVGLRDIFIIGGTFGGLKDFDYSHRSGFNAWTAYNYHGPVNKSYDARGRMVFRGYDELDHAYRDQWRWMQKNTQLPFIVPMSAGWDKRPWGGSSDPLHDQSIPTSAQWKNHLMAGKFSISQQRDSPGGLLCCWNEFGEGSVIEPTKRLGLERLEEVKSVYGQ